MLAQERHEKIIHLIQRKGSVKVSMLTKLFNVSIETVRRDLEHLEKEGILKRVYGGAVVEKGNSNHPTFQIQEKEEIEEKKGIANIASRFVEDGQAIAMDASITNVEIARALKSKFEKLTILTNSLMIVNELADMDNYTIILVGGFINNKEYSLVGHITENCIGNFHLDTAFISVSGISINEGITNHGFEEVQIQKKMIEASQKIIILTDSSKFCTVSLLKVCDLEKVNMIVTDSKLNSTIRDIYLHEGIEIINR